MQVPITTYNFPMKIFTLKTCARILLIVIVSVAIFSIFDRKNSL
nr:MAG TPA: hypothetical protein [Caudoviricetes sp.]